MKFYVAVNEEGAWVPVAGPYDSKKEATEKAASYPSAKAVSRSWLARWGGYNLNADGEARLWDDLFFEERLEEEGRI